MKSLEREEDEEEGICIAMRISGSKNINEFHEYKCAFNNCHETS